MKSKKIVFFVVFSLLMLLEMIATLYKKLLWAFLTMFWNWLSVMYRSLYFCYAIFFELLKVKIYPGKNTRKQNTWMKQPVLGQIRWGGINILPGVTCISMRSFKLIMVPFHLKKNEPQNPMKTLKEFVNSNIPAACNS